MSDTQFERLNHAQKRIDIIDEDWVMDTLSDDGKYRTLDVLAVLLKFWFWFLCKPLKAEPFV